MHSGMHEVVDGGDNEWWTGRCVQSNEGRELRNGGHSKLPVRVAEFFFIFAMLE